MQPINLTLTSKPRAIPKSGLRNYGPGVSTHGGDANGRYTADASLADWARSLWRGKFIIAAATLAFGGGALLWSLRQRPLYDAKTSIELMELNDNFLNRREIDPNAGSGMPLSEADLQTQVKLLRSDSLLERVAKKLHMDERPENQPGLARPGFFVRLAKYPSPPAVSALRTAVNNARSHLTVQGSSESRILELTYESPDPREAAQFLNTLVSEYTDQSLEVRWQASQHTSEWLAKQLTEMKRQLEASEARLWEYARHAGLLVTDDNQNIADVKLRHLEEELGKAQTDRMATQSRYDLLKDSSVDSLPQSVADVALRDNQVKAADLRRRFAELNVTLTPSHLKIREVQAELEELETTIKRQETDLVNRTRNEHLAAAAKERMLTQAYERQVQTVSDQGAKAIEYNILRHEVESSRQLYENMLQTVKKAGVASAIRANNTRVVDYAATPSAPSKPRTQLNCLLGMAMGFFCGLIYVVASHNNAKVIQGPNDIAAVLGTPELGIIPAFKSKTSGLTLAPARFRPPGSVELASSGGRTSMAASFQATLLSILFADGLQPTPILAVTSPSQGDGKTTATCNLGVALAELGKGVLLVDGDVRRPRLHEIFGTGNSRGLVDLLSDPRPIQELDFDDVISPTGTPGLFVLPAGSDGTVAIAQTLFSTRLEELLASLRNRFAAILIDTPPVLQFPDARILARHADCTVLVVRANQTQYDWALAAHRRLREDGSHMLGTILNNYEPAAKDRPYVFRTQ